MLLSLLSRHAVSYDDMCVAPHKMPPPVNNMKLKFVEVLTRHGARAPLGSYQVPMQFRGYWQCDSDDAIAPRMHAAPVKHYRRFKQVLDQRLTEYLPNCRSGDLLLSGMVQHQKLGQAFHEYLYKTTKLFDEETESVPDPKTIYARCSDVERTFRSAQGFLHGLFPPQSPNEIIDIYTDTSDGSLLRPNHNWCSNMTDLWNQHIESEEYKNWAATNIPKVKPVFELLGLTEETGENLNTACDFVTTHYCDNKLLTSDITEEMQQVCLNVTGSYIYDYFLKGPLITGSYTMRELLRIPKMIRNDNSKVKFALMSSHDTTVAAINVLIGGKDARKQRIPPFASHLVLELYEENTSKDLYIRFTLNGDEIPMALFEDKRKIAKFDDFIEAYKEINDFCHEFR
jgi:acid phosphatase